MTDKQADEIVGIYDGIEELEPDISTERLLAMTLDTANSVPSLKHLNLDVSDIVDALMRRR